MSDQGRSVLYILLIGIILIVILGGLFIGYLMLSNDREPDNETPPTAQLTKDGYKLLINISEPCKIYTNMPLSVIINYQYQTSDIFINGTWTSDSVTLYFVDLDQSGTVSNGDYFYRLFGTDTVHVELDYYDNGYTLFLTEADL